MRQNFSDGQEIIFQDLNNTQSRSERMFFDRLFHEVLGRKSDGFFQDSMSPVYQNSTELQLTLGLGFMTESTATNEPDKKLLYLASNATVTLDTPDPGDDRIDIVVVKWKRETTDTESRNFKDEFTEVISPTTLDIVTDWGLEVLYVAGTPAGSPAAPSVPAGYLKVCEMLVTTSTGMSGQSAITDYRNLLPIMGSSNPTGDHEFDKIVGSSSTPGVTHTSLKLAVDNAVAGDKILVLEDQTIDNIPIITVDDVELVFKRGKSLIKGTASKGLQIEGDDCKVVNLRCQDFSTGGDDGVFINGASRTHMDAPRFLNCDTNIDDQGTDTYTNIEIQE